MKFEKKHHHYVPQFWQRGFRNEKGRLYGKCQDGNIRVVSPKTIMQQDYLYTIFDDQWRPSDSQEDTLSAMEAEASELFQRLRQPDYTGTSDDRTCLCKVLALQATRHPDILRRGVKLSLELGKALATAHDHSPEEFEALMSDFSVSEAEAHNCYAVLCARSKEQLAEEWIELTGLSPQSSQLPEQNALRAMPLVAQQLQQMELWLLDVPANEAFALGDTPIPQSDLHQGFTVPLSKSLAVSASPALVPQTLLHRRDATATEVHNINRTQSDNALSVVVGPSMALLAAL